MKADNRTCERGCGAACYPSLALGPSISRASNRDLAFYATNVFPSIEATGSRSHIDVAININCKERCGCRLLVFELLAWGVPVGQDLVSNADPSEHV